MPAIVVTVTKNPGDDDLVPHWDTLSILANKEDARTVPLNPGAMIAEWRINWGLSLEQSKNHAEKEYPDFIWVMTPGGCVPVSLQHTAWDGR